LLVSIVAAVADSRDRAGEDAAEPAADALAGTKLPLQRESLEAAAAG
jgi:hypothetical protein